MQWETVIGLEIHVQLNTQSKIFSGASTQFGADANTQACAVDLGLPGVLPVVNKEAVRKAVSFGLAIGAAIGKHSRFDRKNYFYPDLPKGYQISQMDHPIVDQGEITVQLEDGSEKVIGVTRAHLEEDAGKSLHEDFHGQTGIDLNRAGTPLLEIVSEPDMRNAKEAVAYLRYIHALIQFLGISDGNMAQGSMRCDANVSVRPVGQSEYGTRSEIKNINSFRFVERAINHEVNRQIDLIEDGGQVAQETRLYDADKDETRSMRSKEVANDYRYFPDPDLLPIEIDDSYIEQIRQQLPELPQQKIARFTSDFGLDKSDATQLCSSPELANYFEAALAISHDAKLTANWINSSLAGSLNKAGLEISQSPVSAEHLGQLVLRISDDSITSKIGKKVFELMSQQGEIQSPDEIIKREKLEPIKDDDTIKRLVDEVISANPLQVEQFLAGKDKVLGFFVGQIMKQSRGKANPSQVNQLLKAKLKRDS